jgi:hypothetical protein
MSRMHVILLGLGIASVLAGAAMLGFGISNNEFGLGNALIGAGTTAVVGGLVTIGIAVVVGQLTRIVNTLDMQATGRAISSNVAVAAADPARPQDRVEPAAIPVVPTVPDEAAAKPLSAADAPSAGEPVSPQVAARLVAKAKASEPTVPATAGAEPAVARPPRSPVTSEIPVVLSPRERGFDTVWPAEPATDASKAPPAPSGAATRAASGVQSVTILKSGVIEGMAYTLYSDGSIEAELPQGIMRFATIEELRNHLGNTT